MRIFGWNNVWIFIIYFFNWKIIQEFEFFSIFLDQIFIFEPIHFIEFFNFFKTISIIFNTKYN